MLTSSQIKFYESLSGQEQFILKMLALNGVGIDISDLQRFIRFRYSIVQKLIKDFLEKALTNKLVTLEKSHYYPRYAVNPDFLIYICPQLTGMDALWKQVVKQDPESSSFYFDRDKQYRPLLRNLLYTLCHFPQKYPDYEALFLKYFPDTIAERYSALLQNDSYQPYLHLINPKIVKPTFDSICDDDLRNLVPSAQTISQIERLGASCKIDVKKIVSSIRKNQAFYHGNFSEIVNNATPDDYRIIEKQAIIELMTGNAEEALKIFKKVLTLRAKENHKSPLYFTSIYAPFYYLVALL